MLACLMLTMALAYPSQRSKIDAKGLLYNLYMTEPHHIRENYLHLLLTCVDHATTHVCLALADPHDRDK